MNTLSNTQIDTLEAASNRPDGAIHPLPQRIKGGAALKVIKALSNRGLIEDKGDNDWRIAEAGLLAIGKEPKPAQQEDPQEDPKAKLFGQIAQDHLFIDTLETRNSDSLDFHNVSVWGIQNALEAAYKAGLEDAKTMRRADTRQNSKQAKMIALMKRPQGASLDQITAETGWNKNTIRGAISGTLKKKLGLIITRQNMEGVSHYHISED
ncbi:DUF3489 domain-containing protein [Magnetococcus sp. PR-3]|uniref:DUF3489 domain-containing protein n=1 Tax=Magnetococcus sp. PR-3 TaxID=3120355 RepID=UPI002FCE62AF